MPRSEFCDLSCSSPRFIVGEMLTTLFGGLVLHLALVVFFILHTSQNGSFGKWVNKLCSPLGLEPMTPFLMMLGLYVLGLGKRICFGKKLMVQSQSDSLGKSELAWRSLLPSVSSQVDSVRKPVFARESRACSRQTSDSSSTVSSRN